MGCLQQYQAEKMVEQATWTSSNNIKSWYSSKEGFVISLVGLQRITTINSVVYIEQLTKLKNAVEEKRPELTNRKGVAFHRDDARPHASLVTRQKLLELGWDYFPITFCFDLYKTPWMVKISINNDDIKSYLIQFFANKNHKFYERGITMLPERWQKVIDQNGQRIAE